MRINKKLKEDKEEIAKDKTIFYENLLFKISLALFFLLVSLQVILAIPSVREKFHLSDNSIGTPLNEDEYLYSQGQITLKLIAELPEPNIKILVNGDEATAFESLEMPVTVRDGDVIEIDGSDSTAGYIVKVQHISSNIDGRAINATAKIEKNIKKLLKVQVN